MSTTTSIAVFAVLDLAVIAALAAVCVGPSGSDAVPGRPAQSSRSRTTRASPAAGPRSPEAAAAPAQATIGPEIRRFHARLSSFHGSPASGSRAIIERQAGRDKGATMINGANTGFMLLAASLVMLMTPGLAFFYGGLVGRSNTLTIMIQSFASMGITTVLWWLVGYSLCFSGGADGIYGNFHLAFLRHVSAAFDLRAVGDPARRADRLPDDVRDHHAGADHGRVHEPRHLQGVPDLPRRLAAVRLLPVRAHDLGRRPARAVGRRATSPAGSSCTRAPAWRRSPRSSTSAGASSSTRRTTSRSSRSAPACSGSAGTASTPAAS